MSSKGMAIFRNQGRLARRSGGIRVSHATQIAILTLLFGIVVLAVVVTEGGIGRLSPVVLMGFVLNGAASVLFLALEATRRPFSLVQIHWIFYLSFFVVAPASQCVHGDAMWGYVLTSETYIEANALLFLWAVVFGLFSARKRSGESVDFGGFHRRFYSSLPTVPRGSVYVVVALSAVATVLVVSMVGFDNLFSRSTFDLGVESQTTSLLLNIILRGLPVMCFVVVLVRCKQSSDSRLMLLFAGVLLVLADFPLGMARYNTAMIYGGLLLLAFPCFMEKRGVFPLVFMVLLIVVFPASNAFRSQGFELSVLIESLANAVRNIPSGFLDENYDAYAMLARGIDYVEEAGSSMGYQLLGTLLFFVPRSVWPDKPLGSGYMVAQYQGQTFTNVSFPLPAEAVINFGVVGVIAFAAVFALAIRGLDNAFWSGGLRRFAPFYPVACFVFFFMLRGDLMSSFAYFTGYLTVYIALSLVAFRRGSGGFVQVDPLGDSLIGSPMMPKCETLKRKGPWR